MPSYEMLVLVRKLQKPELAACLKRAANFILNHNAVLRNIENLGEKELHLKIPNPIPNAKRYTSANFFLYQFDTSPETVRKIQSDFFKDNDMIRAYYVKKERLIPENYKCTISDELKPPALRPSVQSLIEKGRKQVPDYDVGGSSAKQIL